MPLRYVDWTRVLSFMRVCSLASNTCFLQNGQSVLRTNRTSDPGHKLFVTYEKNEGREREGKEEEEEA